MNSEINMNDRIAAFSRQYAAVRQEIGRDIVGQEEVVEGTLIALIAGGNVLLEGVPGVGKTRLVRSVGRTLDLMFSRIQFTPDLMPADVTGTNLIIKENGNNVFSFEPGPVFANLVLADEINRATPKTQAALLEAMQERSVTASGTIYKLDEPFFVMATQNPIEQEGTYPLPEAQLDRFMFNINVGYPSLDDEIRIVKNTTADKNFEIKQILSAEEIIYFQNLIRKIPINDNVLEYAVRLVNKTRPDSEIAPEITRKFIHWGAGPRASQYLVIGAKTVAVLGGKYSPDIEDVQAVAKIVLRHRVVKNYKAEAEGLSIEDIIDELVKD